MPVFSPQETSHLRPEPHPLRVGEFRREVFRFYRANLTLFLSLLAPPLAFACGAAFLSRKAQWLLAASLLHPGSGNADVNKALITLSLVSLVWLFTTWLIYCFAFAAVCVAVNKTSAGERPRAEECFNYARERLVPLVKTSLLLFLLIGLGMAASLFVMLTALTLASRFHWPEYLPIALYVVTVVLSIAYLSSYSLAIPALMVENPSPGKALSRSDRLTNDRMAILLAVILESLVLTFLAWTLPFLMANLLEANAQINIPEWPLWLIAFGAVLMVQPIMFIGLSLLYEKLKSPEPTRSDKQLLV